MDLNSVWFLLIGVLLGGYVVLDGFDFGVGVLHLFARDNDERRIHINAIAPVWDGNEVWLLTGGGALFAAFPIVYAAIFSGFYIALMLLLTALIFRAVSMEFRGKIDSYKWMRVWDWCFGIGSLLPAILFGVAFGNILHGVPITEKMAWAGSFIGLLNPYAVLIGVLSLVLFTMHGGAYLLMKTEGELRQRLQSWVTGSWICVVVLYAGATIATYFVSPFLFSTILHNPLFWILACLLVVSVISVPVLVHGSKGYFVFLASSVSILCMFGIAALSLFPRLVPSSIDPAYSLTIYNASSTPRTLSTMLIIALIGMPIVLVYTGAMYRIFKGNVKITEDSY